MPAQTLEALFRSLRKGELAQVYYFHGPEDVLKDEAVAALLDRALEPGLRDFNFDQRSAAQLDPDELHTLCNTLPMLAERRVVLLRDVEAWKRKTRGRAEFLRYLEQPNPETVVILMQGTSEESDDKELTHSTYSVRFDPLRPDRATRWVLHRAEKLGLALDAPAAEHLVLSVGADLAALASELTKLAALPANDPLTAERIGELVGVHRGETLWDWRAAVLNDRTDRAVALLPAVLAQPGVHGVRLVMVLGTALVGLGVARSLYDRGMRGRSLEDGIFKALLKNRPAGLLSYKEEAAQWSRCVEHWPAERIRSALRVALATDQALKSTTVSDERGLVGELVLRIGEGGKDGKDGKGGKDRQTRNLSSGLRRVLVRALALLPALPLFPVLPAFSQTDPRLVEVIRSAQEGQGDSARIKVKRLLASTSPGDTLYPQILYTQAMVSGDAAEMRRQLQRVAVEYSSSSWADDALLRLVQLDYASGNLDGAARNLERIRRDYPGSSLLPQAAYWAARTYFDQKNPDLACRWIADGVAAAQGNVELQNQLGYLNQRCGLRADALRQPSDSPSVVVSAVPDSTRPPQAMPPPPNAARPDSARIDSAAAKPAAPRARFRIQITAVRTAAAAETIVTKLKARGFAAVTVEEGGLYKVRLGSYATRDEAVAALPEIKAKLGGSPFVVAES